MQKWEYKIFATKSASELLIAINQLGEESWRVISSLLTNDHEFQVILEREKKEVILHSNF